MSLVPAVNLTSMSLLERIRQASIETYRSPQHISSRIHICLRHCFYIEWRVALGKTYAHMCNRGTVVTRSVCLDTRMSETTLRHDQK